MEKKRKKKQIKSGDSSSLPASLFSFLSTLEVSSFRRQRRPSARKVSRPVPDCLSSRSHLSPASDRQIESTHDEMDWSIRESEEAGDLARNFNCSAKGGDPKAAAADALPRPETLWSLPPALPPVLCSSFLARRNGANERDDSIEHDGFAAASPGVSLIGRTFLQEKSRHQTRSNEEPLHFPYLPRLSRPSHSLSTHTGRRSSKLSSTRKAKKN